MKIKLRERESNYVSNDSFSEEQREAKLKKKNVSTSVIVFKCIFVRVGVTLQALLYSICPGIFLPML